LLREREGEASCTVKLRVKRKQKNLAGGERVIMVANLKKNRMKDRAQKRWMAGHFFHKSAEKTHNSRKKRGYRGPGQRSKKHKGIELPTEGGQRVTVLRIWGISNTTGGRKGARRRSGNLIWRISR